MQTGLIYAFKRVVIKLPTKYVDVGKMRIALRSHGLMEEQCVRLFVLAGNDYCAGCAIGNPRAIIGTYVKQKQLIGDLSTPKSVRALYYLSFITSAPWHARPSSSCLPFSAQWCQETHTFIAYRATTRSAANLLPQDEDRDLKFTRMQWCVDRYWRNCVNPIKSSNFDAEYTRFDKDTGAQIITNSKTTAQKAHQKNDSSTV